MQLFMWQRDTVGRGALPHVLLKLKMKMILLAAGWMLITHSSMQGVLGRRAASSASALLIALMALVITVLVVATACDMVLKRRLKGHPKFEKVASA